MTPNVYPNPQSPYYDWFNPLKKYKHVAFKPGQAIQSQELNEMQRVLAYSDALLCSSLYTPKSIIRGGATLMQGRNFTISESLFFGEGYIHEIPETVITIEELEYDLQFR
jgi:hypothetical protein